MNGINKGGRDVRAPRDLHGSNEQRKETFHELKMKQYFSQGNLRIIGSYIKPNIH